MGSDDDNDRKVRGVAFRDLFQPVVEATQYTDSDGNFRELDRSDVVRQCIRVGLPIIEGMREHPDWPDPTDMDPRELKSHGLETWKEMKDPDDE